MPGRDFTAPCILRHLFDPDQFLATVDAIEALSGLDFLSGLPDEVEEPLEAGRAVSLWWDISERERDSNRVSQVAEI